MTRPLRDVVIVLPGITGSVLQQHGRDVWAVSGGAVWNALTTLGRSLHRLRLDGDDPDVDDLGDGVTALRLIDGVHLIPGLVKIDGYGRLLGMLQRDFRTLAGSVHDDRPANLYAFPYDWRRDNRVAARKLGRLIAAALPRWRRYHGADDARVILIAHSMGGLVARHYLEVLGGWEHCRALITFGTPYRGAPDALGFLVNGHRKLRLDLAPLLRSFTSVYQLLPIYPAVYDGAAWRRPAEVDLAHVDRDRAADALAFHRAIEVAVDQRRRAGGSYTLLPILGTRQPTRQSAVAGSDGLRLTHDLPGGVDPLLGDGDGTVPRLSAIPIELSRDHRETFLAERHSSLQNHGGALTDLRARLESLVVDGLDAIRGPAAPTAPPATGIAVQLDDLYLAGEPVRVGVTVVGGGAPPPLEVEVTPVRGGSPRSVPVGDTPEVEFTGLQPGTYRLEARPARFTAHGPGAVHDLFEVAPAG